MNRNRRRTISMARALVLLAAVAVAAVAQDPPAQPAEGPTSMTVRTRRAPLLDGRDMLASRVLKMLGEGDLVVVVDPSQAAKVRAGVGKPTKKSSGKRAKPEIVWYRVSPVTDLSLRGYMHHTVLAPGRRVLEATSALSGTSAPATSQEVVLAGRGFDETVERDYRVRNAGLGSSFALLDAIESDPRYNPQLEEVGRFVQEGLTTTAAAPAAEEVAP